MPFVNAQCTNCGAGLEVDSTKEAAVCPYCHSAYIVEKAINNYNTVNHIQASVVNVYGGNTADFVIRAGTLEKYNGAAEEVVIPNNVRHISRNAFRGCRGLKKVTVPGSVECVEGLGASDTCEAPENLEEVIIENGVKQIGKEAFFSCPKLKKVIIPESVIIIGALAFRNCVSLTEINLPPHIQEIGCFAFLNCSNLTAITLPDSLTKLWWNAFENCTSLQNITLSKNIDTLFGTFAGCHSLTSITIPAGVKIKDPGCSYKNGAFYYCSKLATVIMEDGQTPPHNAFKGTPWLQKQEEAYMKQQQAWRNAKLCDRCGGPFEGLFQKKCSKCGVKKQY